MNLSATLAAAAIFCVAAGSAIGQRQSNYYDWDQSASQAAYGRTTSSDSYDWGQTAVNASYYGRQPSSTEASAKRRSVAGLLDSGPGNKKAGLGSYGTSANPPHPTGSGSEFDPATH
jgi:hypothetical protein